MHGEAVANRALVMPWLLPAASFALPVVLAFGAKGTAIIFALVALAALIDLLRLKRFALPETAVLAALGIGLAWCALSAAWAYTPGLALPKTAQLAGLCAGGLLAMAGGKQLSPEQRMRVLPALVAGLAVTAIILAEERLTNLGLRRLIYGLRGIPIQVSPIVEMYMYKTCTAVSCVLGVLAAGIALRRNWRLGAAVAVLSALVMVGATGSLAGLVALAVGGLLLAVKSGRLSAGLVCLGVVAGFTLAPLAAYLPDTAEISRWMDLPSSALHRTIIWHFAAGNISAHPILGWGLDAARELPGGESREMLTMASGKHWLEQVLPLHPHNMFIQVWLELGAAGAVLAGGLLLILVRSAKRMGPPAVAVMGAALLVSSSSFGAWQSWWLSVVWLMATILMASTADGEV